MSRKAATKILKALNEAITMTPKEDIGRWSERTHIRGRFAGLTLCGRGTLGLTVVDDVTNDQRAGVCRACWKAKHGTWGPK